MYAGMTGAANGMIAAALPEATAGHEDLHLKALGLYRRSCLDGRLSRLWRLLSARSSALRALSAAGRVSAGHYVGLRTVAVREIRGSEGRSKDFDAEFHPSGDHIKERWVRVALARLQGVVLPPVELIQVGAEYYVRDGHHRISVARALGEQYIDAEVTALATP